MATAPKVTCHGAGLVSADADFKNSFTVFVQQGKIGGISVAFEGKQGLFGGRRGAFEMFGEA